MLSDLSAACTAGHTHKLTNTHERTDRYAAAPQCVPSRTTMFAGRHTHAIKAWSNSQGVSGIPGRDWTTAGGLDPSCVKAYDMATCRCVVVRSA